MRELPSPPCMCWCAVDGKGRQTGMVLIRSTFLLCTNGQLNAVTRQAIQFRALKLIGAAQVCRWKAYKSSKITFDLYAGQSFQTKYGLIFRGLTYMQIDLYGSIYGTHSLIQFRVANH